MNNNFERIKQSEDEYDMADLVIGYIGNHLNELKNEDGSINSLPFLRWLQSRQNIFGAENEIYKGYIIEQHDGEDGYRVDFGTKRSKMVDTVEDAKKIIDLF